MAKYGVVLCERSHSIGDAARLLLVRRFVPHGSCLMHCWCLSRAHMYSQVQRSSEMWLVLSHPSFPLVERMVDLSHIQRWILSSYQRWIYSVDPPDFNQVDTLVELRQMYRCLSLYELLNVHFLLPHIEQENGFQTCVS